MERTRRKTTQGRGGDEKEEVDRRRAVPDHRARLPKIGNKIQKENR